MPTAEENPASPQASGSKSASGRSGGPLSSAGDGAQAAEDDDQDRPAAESRREEAASTISQAMALARQVEAGEQPAATTDSARGLGEAQAINVLMYLLPSHGMSTLAGEQPSLQQHLGPSSSLQHGQAPAMHVTMPSEQPYHQFAYEANEDGGVQSLANESFAGQWLQEQQQQAAHGTGSALQQEQEEVSKTPASERKQQRRDNQSKASYSGSGKPLAICQVDGCGRDLTSSSFKDYHRRSRVCAEHMKSLSVVIHGVESRYCHQCHKFQELSAFDLNMHTCRVTVQKRSAKRHAKDSALSSDSKATRPKVSSTEQQTGKREKARGSKLALQEGSSSQRQQQSVESMQNQISATSSSQQLLLNLAQPIHDQLGSSMPAQLQLQPHAASLQLAVPPQLQPPRYLHEQYRDRSAIEEERLQLQQMLYNSLQQTQPGGGSAAVQNANVRQGGLPRQLALAGGASLLLGQGSSAGGLSQLPNFAHVPQQGQTSMSPALRQLQLQEPEQVWQRQVEQQRQLEQQVLLQQQVEAQQQQQQVWQLQGQQPQQQQLLWQVQGQLEQPLPQQFGLLQGTAGQPSQQLWQLQAPGGQLLLQLQGQGQQDQPSLQQQQQFLQLQSLGEISQQPPQQQLWHPQEPPEPLQQQQQQVLPLPGQGHSQGLGQSEDTSDALLERFSIELHGVTPDMLAPDLRERLRGWIRSSGFGLLQDFVRPGCTVLVFDLINLATAANSATATSATRPDGFLEAMFGAQALPHTDAGLSSLGFLAEVLADCATSVVLQSGSQGMCIDCNSEVLTYTWLPSSQLHHPVLRLVSPCCVLAGTAACEFKLIIKQQGSGLPDHQLQPGHQLQPEQLQQKAGQQLSEQLLQRQGGTQSAHHGQGLSAEEAEQGEAVQQALASLEKAHSYQQSQLEQVEQAEPGQQVKVFARHMGEFLGSVDDPDFTLTRACSVFHLPGNSSGGSSVEVHHSITLHVPHSAGLIAIECESSNTSLMSNWQPVLVLEDEAVVAELQGLSQKTAAGSGPAIVEALLVNLGLMLMLQLRGEGQQQQQQQQLQTAFDWALSAARRSRRLLAIWWPDSQLPCTRAMVSQHLMQLELQLGGSHPGSAAGSPVALALSRHAREKLTPQGHLDAFQEQSSDGSTAAQGSSHGDSTQLYNALQLANGSSTSDAASKQLPVVGSKLLVKDEAADAAAGSSQKAAPGSSSPVAVDACCLPDTAEPAADDGTVMEASRSHASSRAAVAAASRLETSHAGSSSGGTDSLATTDGQPAAVLMPWAAMVLCKCLLACVVSGQGMKQHFTLGMWALPYAVILLLGMHGSLFKAGTWATHPQDLGRLLHLYRLLVVTLMGLALLRIPPVITFLSSLWLDLPVTAVYAYIEGYDLRSAGLVFELGDCLAWYLLHMRVGGQWVSLHALARGLVRCMLHKVFRSRHLHPGGLPGRRAANGKAKDS